MTVLTIGIPTHNRGMKIHETIVTVIESINFAKIDDIEIIICDNGSTAENLAILQELCTKHGGIKLSSNSENIGFDQNLDKVFQLATGEWVKLLADDDLLRIDSLLDLFNILTNNPTCDAVIQNFQTFLHNKEIENSSLEIAQANEDIAYLRDCSYLEKCNYRFGQVSTLTIRRSAWNAVAKQHVIGLNHLHGYVLHKVAELGLVILAQKESLDVRLGSPNFSVSEEDVFNVPKGNLKILRKLRNEGFDQVAINKEIAFQAFHLLGQIPHLRRYSKINGLAFLVSNFRYFYRYKTFWKQAFPIMILPRFLYLGVIGVKRFAHGF